MILPLPGAVPTSTAARGRAYRELLGDGVEADAHVSRARDVVARHRARRTPPHVAGIAVPGGGARARDEAMILDAHDHHRAQTIRGRSKFGVAEASRMGQGWLDGAVGLRIPRNAAEVP
ncbi:hypothetical protein ACIRL2_27295 [Embleya sp. NPDC127516]|uniref:hypothetical protein n=1 Tax=Embleya sp. NPDC127516 TaxID=3363990 RepID=UPI00381467B1